MLKVEILVWQRCNLLGLSLGSVPGGVLCEALSSGLFFVFLLPVLLEDSFKMHPQNSLTLGLGLYKNLVFSISSFTASKTFTVSGVRRTPALGSQHKICFLISYWSFWLFFFLVFHGNTFVLKCTIWLPLFLYGLVIQKSDFVFLCVPISGFNIWWNIWCRLDALRNVFVVCTDLTLYTAQYLLSMKHLQLHWDDNVDVCLDVFLFCFIQNEDENRASESKKTKLEEKAPSGHKTSSSREWVPWLFSTWKLGVIKKTDLPPFPSLHNSVSSLLFDG